MKKFDYVALALAALVLGLIIAIAPKTETIADEASFANSGIDISGLTRNTRNLPVEEFPAH